MRPMYEIQGDIERLIDECTDPETGEFLGDMDALNALEMERTDKMEQLCLYAKNLKSEITALKAEEASFSERRKRTERRLDGLERYISGALNGEKLKTDRVMVTFRKSTAVNVQNELLCRTFCENQGYDDCIRYKPPELDKPALKRLISLAGVEVPGVELVERQSMTIK